MVITGGKDVQYIARIRKEAASLTQAGWRVVVIGLVQTELALPLVETIDGSTFLRINPQTAHRFFPGKVGFIFRTIIGFIRLIYHIRRINARVYQGKDLTGLLMLGLAGIWRRPIIYDAAEIYFERPIARLTKLLKPILITFEKLMARRSVYILATSQSHADALIEILGVKQPLVIRNASDVASFEDYPHDLGLDSARVVVHSGWLLNGRHLTELVDTLPLLPDDVHLLLIGDGPRRKALIDHAHARGVNARLTITGAIPPTQMVSALRQGTIAAVLFTSQYRSYKLGLPNKFFEAVAAELPIIATPVPEVERLINEHDIGVLCEATPESIAIAIMTALDPQHLKRIKMNIQQLRETLTWEHEVQKLIDVYRTLLE